MKRRIDPSRATNPPGVDPIASGHADRFGRGRQEPVVGADEAAAFRQLYDHGLSGPADPGVDHGEMNRPGRKSDQHRAQEEGGFRDPVSGEVLKIEVTLTVVR